MNKFSMYMKLVNTAVITTAGLLRGRTHLLHIELEDLCREFAVVEIKAQDNRDQLRCGYQVEEMNALGEPVGIGKMWIRGCALLKSELEGF